MCQNFYAVVRSCSFEDNIAGDDGGAITIYASNDNLLVIDSVFINNTADRGNGGAFRLYSGNYYVSIKNCR